MIHRIKKTSSFLLILLFLPCWIIPVIAQDNNSDQQLFHLKIYHLDTHQQEQRLDDYLESAYLPALHRLGNKPVGVFKPVGQDTTDDKRIYVLTSYDTFQEFDLLDEKLAEDKQYQQAGSDFTNTAHDNPAYREIESILLRAFSYAPELMKSDLETPKTDRVYELRSYESATEAQNVNKVEMFNEGGEVELFEELGFNAIFYGNVLIGNDMPNLIYMVSFADMESREKHWNAFIESSEWKRISSMERYQNNVSHIDNYFLRATEYSDL